MNCWSVGVMEYWGQWRKQIQNHYLTPVPLFAGLEPLRNAERSKSAQDAGGVWKMNMQLNLPVDFLCLTPSSHGIFHGSTRFARLLSESRARTSAIMKILACPMKCS